MSLNTTITRKSVFKEPFDNRKAPAPGIAVAYAPSGALTVDRCLLTPSFTVGRSSTADFTILDDKISKLHFRILRTERGFRVQDLGSTNGTFSDGEPVLETRPLADSAVIRCGESVLVFHENADFLFAPNADENFGIEGRFHVAPLIKKLREAILSPRHVLLVGPTGTGKELAARALCSFYHGSSDPKWLITHNAARFANEEEATTTLFGVGKGVFSGVGVRQGLIEQADGKSLFLDEIHNLPERVQRTLLRVIEDGLISRIGEPEPKEIKTHFIFASNLQEATYGLAHDFFQRLRLVEIPPLGERKADIPAIFNSFVSSTMRQHGLNADEVYGQLGGDHYEALVLDGMPKGNVRELIDISDRLATQIAAGSTIKAAVRSVFSERFKDGPLTRRLSDVPPSLDEKDVSHYEQSKAEIIEAIEECKGNLSATERLLRSRGISCSRRWLATYCKRWGVVRSRL